VTRPSRSCASPARSRSTRSRSTLFRSRPFDEARAERYARELLIPAEDFGPLIWVNDAELAELFGAPSSRCGRRASISARDRPVPGHRIDRRLARAHARGKATDHLRGGQPNRTT
jgi:hypothetical protein